MAHVARDGNPPKVNALLPQIAPHPHPIIADPRTLEHNLPPMADPFYTGQYSYRKPMVLIVGSILFLSTGACLTVFAASAIVKPPHGREILTALLMTAVVGTLFVVGCYLLWAFIRHHRLLVEIDDTGIRYGKKSVPWERVRRIAGLYQHKRFQLKLVRRGIASDLYLATDDGLTEKEYQRLISRLTARLKDRFPDLRIG